MRQMIKVVAKDMKKLFKSIFYMFKKIKVSTGVKMRDIKRNKFNF